MCAKNETPVILNILYSCKSIAMKPKDWCRLSGLNSSTLVFFTNCHTGSPDWRVCCFEIDVSGYTWAMTPVLGDPNVTAFLKALVLAPILFNLYSNDLPVTHGRKFIYADDICLAIQGQYFSELECSHSSDMARMSHFCRQ